jgi:hypothetical protein
MPSLNIARSQFSVSVWKGLGLTPLIDLIPHTHIAAVVGSGCLLLPINLNQIDRFSSLVDLREVSLVSLRLTLLKCLIL